MRIAASEVAVPHRAERLFVLMEVVMMMVVMIAPFAAAIFGARLFLNRKLLSHADVEFGHAVLPFYEGEIGMAPSHVNQIIINK